MSSVGDSADPRDLTLAAVQTVFPDAQPEGDGFVACCRGHTDTRPSLRISRGESHPVVMHCRSHCGEEARERNASALGLTVGELDARLLGLAARAVVRRSKLTTDEGHDSQSMLTPTKANRVARYIYRNVDGTVAFYVDRHELNGMKTFRQRAPDGTGSVKGIRRVLYRLDELRGAEAVFLVEGEKCAEAVWHLGLPATTWPGGANGWRPEYALQLLTLNVRAVVVLPDNDDAGRAAMAAAINDLRPYDLDLRRLDLPNLPDKGDVADWVAAGGTREQLIALADAATPEDNTTPPPTADAAVAWMNRQHFVAMDGGKVEVFTERRDPVLNRSVLTRSSFSAITNLYAPYMVTLSGSGQASVGRLWVKHPQRRTYGAVTFAPGMTVPGVYNLWRGFAVEPGPGNWSLLDEHLRDNICRKRPSHYRYVRGWMARCVQRMTEPGAVALVLRGKRGTGKGIVGRELGALFGQHFVHVAHARHLVGNFNAHLRDAVLIFGDEAFYAGDKQVEGVLKMLITEPVIPVEGKGRDVVMAKNMTHLLLASNSEWVVPAGMEERRFCVLDVSDARMQDTEYFTAIQTQMERGGREAMLYDLLHEPLDDFDIYAVPQTRALWEQKLQSMSPVQRWWFGVLKDGRLLASDDGWTGDVAKSSLYDAYVEALQAAGVPRRATIEELAMQLGTLVPRLYTHRPWQTKGPRNRRWSFPPLDDCRTHFEGLVHYAVRWD